MELDQSFSGFLDDSITDLIPDLLNDGFDHLPILPIESGDIELENIEEKAVSELDDPLLREFLHEVKGLDLNRPELRNVMSGDFDGSFSLPNIVDCNGSTEEEKSKVVETFKSKDIELTCSMSTELSHSKATTKRQSTVAKYHSKTAKPRQLKVTKPQVRGVDAEQLNDVRPPQSKAPKPQQKAVKTRHLKTAKHTQSKAVVPSPPPKEDAFATLNKLWPNHAEIIKDVPRARGGLGRKYFGKTAKPKQINDEGSSEEVDIETVDEELNKKSGAEMLCMGLSEPKMALVVKVEPKEDSTVISDAKNGRDDLKNDVKESLKIPLKVEPLDIEHSSTSNADQDCKNNTNDEKIQVPKIEPKVESVEAKHYVVQPLLTPVKKEPKKSSDPDAARNRELLMKMLPRGAIIKQKDPSSAIKTGKTPQSTQARSAILIPYPDKSLSNLKNGNKFVKTTLSPKDLELPIQLPQLMVSSKRSNHQSPSSPFYNSSPGTLTPSPSDPFRVTKPKQVSQVVSTDKILLKPGRSDVQNGTNVKTKQPNPVTLVTPILILANKIQDMRDRGQLKDTSDLSRPLFNELKDLKEFKELEKLLPTILPLAGAPKSDHDYCSSNVTKKAGIATKPNALFVNTPQTDPWISGTKNESKSVIDSEGVGAVITIKSGGKDVATKAPENKLKHNLVNKEDGKVTSPWHQDFLLNQLRATKEKRRNSGGDSLPCKRHRSSRSPSTSGSPCTSGSSQSNYCVTPSPSSSPRNYDGKFTNIVNRGKSGNNDRRPPRSYRRSSSSRSRSPVVSRRKSYSRSRSRSKSPWNRSKKMWMRSRSRSYSRSRSRSHSGSPTRSWSKSGGRQSSDYHGRNPKDLRRGKSPVWASNSYKPTKAEKMRQIQEKRVIFVGNIPNDTTKKSLYDRFVKFGEILDVSVHFREIKENYGFVTFTYQCDASEALEHGNDNPKLPRLDLRYGCGRQYRKPRYCDFDSQVAADIPSPKLDFDSLLQSTRAELYRKRQC